MRPKLRWLLLAWVLVGIRPAGATEPVERFLAALRAGKYYDEALFYLGELQSRPSLDDKVRQRLAYEEAATLLAGASEVRDPQVRQKRLSQASELFEKFCAEQPQHALVGSARTQLASILVERARGDLAAGEADATPRARKLFQQAAQQFASAEKLLDAQFTAMPKLIPPDDREALDRKRQLSSNVAEARLMAASMDYELARTYDPQSKEAQQHYATAAKNYAALNETYRTRAAGLLARLWEGRCYQELGQFTQALGCYRELMDLPDAAGTREIRTKSTRQAMECWLADSVKKYQAAIERGERWDKESAANAPEADVLAIRYLTAVAYQEQAQALPDKDPNRKRLTGAARDYAGPVADRPGEFQRPAKMLLVALSGGKARAASDEPAPPKAFTEALEQGRLALEQMQQAALEVTAAAAKKDQAALEKAQQKKDALAARAMDLLRLALSLKDKETTADALNTARYYLCYLNWDLGNYYDAAVLGEFLANHFPDTLPGRHGAKIAMAAWVRLYDESKAEDRSFEVEQIQRVAEMTFRRWPDQQEAEDAALTLVNFAATSGKFEKVLEYLNNIPADSPRRGQAELRAGQALWSAYLHDLRQPDDQRMPPEKRNALRKQAHDLLTSGVKRVEGSGQVDATLASAAFTLGQMDVETGDSAGAIKWLENPKYGPLTLIKAGDPAATRDNFAVETYKMAMRAYIAVSPQQLEKAEAVMDALEKLVQGSGEGQAGDNLTAIYISLGRQLQEHLKELRASGKTEELNAVSRAFEVFLDRVIQRGAGGNLSSLNWVAETFASLGAGHEDGGGISAYAQGYYKKAASAYKQLLELAEKDPKFRDNPDSLLGLRLRLADCYRGAGDFDQATLEVTNVLREKPTLFSAQVQGAQIYQDRGAVDPTGYEKAIMGGSPDRTGRNLIWGWARLSKTTMSNPKFAATFHQARLNIAESRYRYALAQKDATRKHKVLEAAVGDLRSTYQLHPDLGGPETAAKYDRMLKKIQKALGVPETGLKEFKQTETQNTASQ